MRPLFVLRQQSIQMHFSFYIVRRGAVGSTFASHSGHSGVDTGSPDRGFLWNSSDFPGK